MAQVCPRLLKCSLLSKFEHLPRGNRRQPETSLVAIPPWSISKLSSGLPLVSGLQHAHPPLPFVESLHCDLHRYFAAHQIVDYSCAARAGLKAAAAFETSPLESRFDRWTSILRQNKLAVQFQASSRNPHHHHLHLHLTTARYTLAPTIQKGSVDLILGCCCNY